jgi:hypothetical protein
MPAVEKEGELKFIRTAVRSIWFSLTQVADISLRRTWNGNSIKALSSISTTIHLD